MTPDEIMIALRSVRDGKTYYRLRDELRKGRGDLKDALAAYTGITYEICYRDLKRYTQLLLDAWGDDICSKTSPEEDRLQWSKDLVGSGLLPLVMIKEIVAHFGLSDPNASASFKYQVASHFLPMLRNRVFKGKTAFGIVRYLLKVDVLEYLDPELAIQAIESRETGEGGSLVNALRIIRFGRSQNFFLMGGK